MKPVANNHNNSLSQDELLAEIQFLKAKNTELESEKNISTNKISALQKQISLLQEQLKLNRHNQYAKKSEAKNNLQIEIPFEPVEEPEEADTATDTDSTDDAETITYTRKKSKSPRAIDVSNLETEQVIHDLSDDDKQCDCCGGELHEIGRDVSKKVEYIPATFKCIEHVSVKYACRPCERIKSGRKPDSIMPKAMAGDSLLVACMLSKYQQHMPIYRQAAVFKQAGFAVPTNTIGNWVLAAGEALQPIIDAQKKQITLTRTLQVDETPVKMLSEDKTGYMWCYHGCDPGNRYVLYQFDTSRAARVPIDMLKDFSGIMQTDGYAGYNQLRRQSNIMAVGCWAHARRKYTDVIKIAGKDKKPGKAHQAVAFIEKLYRIEKTARDDNYSHEQRYALRQEKSKPVIAKFKAWLDKSINQVPKSTKIGEAIAYSLNQWPYLEAYLNHGEVEIDNNWVENKIRPLALGRKNWLFLGNDRGAQAASAIYSLIQTCLLNEVRPQDYFMALLPQLPAVRRGDIDAATLLPQHLKD